jgi:hypothetical protein
LPHGCHSSRYHISNEEFKAEKEGRKEGKKEGRKKGKKESRKEERKEGRKEGRQKTSLCRSLVQRGKPFLETSQLDQWMAKGDAVAICTGLNLHKEAVNTTLIGNE